MSFIGKEYTLVSHKNFDGFLKAHGVDEDTVQQYLNTKATTKLLKSGDQYTCVTTDADGTKEVAFKSGVEFDDVFGKMKTPVKATYVVDGNTFTQTFKSDKGTIVSKGEFSGNDYVVTATSDAFDGGESKFFYKA